MFCFVFFWFIFQIFFHLLLNCLSIVVCFLAAGITGIYGTAVHFDGYEDFLSIQRSSKYIPILLPFIDLFLLPEESRTP